MILRLAAPSLPSLSADIARAPADLRVIYAQRLDEAATILAAGFPVASPDAKSRALTLLSLVAGGLLLSRAATGAAADEILRDTREAALKLINEGPSAQPDRP
jgi:hypothetical protein